MKFNRTQAAVKMSGNTYLFSPNNRKVYDGVISCESSFGPKTSGEPLLKSTFADKTQISHLSNYILTPIKMKITLRSYLLNLH